MLWLFAMSVWLSSASWQSAAPGSYTWQSSARGHDASTAARPLTTCFTFALGPSDLYRLCCTAPLYEILRAPPPPPPPPSSSSSSAAAAAAAETRCRFDAGRVSAAASCSRAPPRRAALRRPPQRAELLPLLARRRAPHAVGAAAPRRRLRRLGPPLGVANPLAQLRRHLVGHAVELAHAPPAQREVDLAVLVAVRQPALGLEQEARRLERHHVDRAERRVGEGHHDGVLAQFCAISEALRNSEAREQAKTATIM